jgi:protein ImuB
MRAPSPATTLARPVAVQLRDASDRLVIMEGRGFLSEPPATLLFSHQLRREVVWHAGPWPLVERWWALNRRRAHLQILLVSGEALLLTAESNRWWLAGIYD